MRPPRQSAKAAGSKYRRTGTGRALPHQPRPEERAPERLSKDARVSKDGHRRDRARGHPSSFESLRTAAREGGLLRMRSESRGQQTRYLLPSPVVDRVLIGGAGRNETPTDCPLIVVGEPFSRVGPGRGVAQSRQL